MTVDLNLPLRSDVLDKALNLENTVNSILLIYLNIDREDRRAFTNKSSNLSFKNKIDLLFDLEIFNNEEYQYFLLLMEFRNKFMHDIECSSFTIVVKSLKSGQSERLLKFDNHPEETELEIRYKTGFTQLYYKTIEIALEKYRIRKELIEEKGKLLKNRIDDTVYFIDYFFDIFQSLCEISKPSISDTAGVVDFKTNIIEKIGKEMDNLHEIPRYQQIQLQLKKDTTHENLKLYFK